ncbi:hypothetical protein TRFO_20341 [Tritrichomonas foetus]|uniref:Uncharacterized protein n=1 Tax=Tritrichomonas foetus TaxID=1144522 RepID=A0A1J4KG51_9EUKA|nr:hypothetical protein TRFO_20341 [Tritrichomonas foetus]|eukprot:OHT10385.1 hypothetical protein TRFO_20341 [Tritrichomonas foetus]
MQKSLRDFSTRKILSYIESTFGHNYFSVDDFHACLQEKYVKSITVDDVNRILTGLVVSEKVEFKIEKNQQFYRKKNSRFELIEIIRKEIIESPKTIDEIVTNASIKTNRTAVRDCIEIMMAISVVHVINDKNPRKYQWDVENEARIFNKDMSFIFNDSKFYPNNFNDYLSNDNEDGDNH